MVTQNCCVTCTPVYAGAPLRGCLISSSANQTPYTQNSIRSLHKRTSARSSYA